MHPPSALPISTHFAMLPQLQLHPKLVTGLVRFVIIIFRPLLIYV